MNAEKTVTYDRCGTSVALARAHVAGDPTDPDNPAEVEVVCAYCAIPEDRIT